MYEAPWLSRCCGYRQQGSLGIGTEILTMGKELCLKHIFVTYLHGIHYAICVHSWHWSEKIINMNQFCMAITHYGWKVMKKRVGQLSFFLPFHSIHSSISPAVAYSSTALPLFRPLLHLLICWDPGVIYSLSSLAFIKPQMGCHASPSSLACPVWKARPFRGDGGMRKRPEHSTREEGWPLCLHLPGATAPLRHWCGITVPERSRDRESTGGRWTREKSQAVLRANPQDFGVFSLFDHILEPWITSLNLSAQIHEFPCNVDMNSA